jgi:hypothetical protein
MTNNPGIAPADFRILSIGTGISRKAIITDYKSSDNANTLDIYNKNKDKPYVVSSDSRKFQLEVGKMATSILGDPPDSASFMAYAIMDPHLSNNGNLVRINPCVTPQFNGETNEYEVPKVYRDDEAKFLATLNLDMDAVLDKDIMLIDEVAAHFITTSPNQPSIPNQYIRGDRNAPFRIGYGSYAEAKAQWQHICREA